jgi:serine/threonine protein kinase
MYDGPANDVWSLGILLTKLLSIPHPFIHVETDTESIARTKIVEARPEYHFRPEHIGRGKAASLIMQMLEPNPWKRITVS